MKKLLCTLIIIANQIVCNPTQGEFCLPQNFPSLSEVKFGEFSPEYRTKYDQYLKIKKQHQKNVSVAPRLPVSLSGLGLALLGAKGLCDTIFAWPEVVSKTEALLETWLSPNTTKETKEMIPFIKHGFVILLGTCLSGGVYLLYKHYQHFASSQKTIKELTAQETTLAEDLQKIRKCDLKKDKQK